MVVGQGTAVDAGTLEGRDCPVGIRTKVEDSPCPSPRLTTGREAAFEIDGQAVEVLQLVQEIPPDRRHGPLPLVLVDESPERHVTG